MLFPDLKIAVQTHAAIRRRQRLQPVGGQGDKIFPPTYPTEKNEKLIKGESQHVFERRRVAGADVWCALVDSVQSQANRLEEALLGAIADGVKIPHIDVDFSAAGLTGINKITSLDAPHRIYDAILRDSMHGNTEFPKSEVGRRLAEAKLGDATALLEVSPTALIFGAWNSTGEGGGMGAKFPRTLVSEIAAFNVSVEELADSRTGEVNDARTAGRRTSSRIDPLGILSKVEVYQGDDRAWNSTEDGFGKKKPTKVRPSEINHGNIKPSVQALGITCDYAEQTAVLSFAGLRRLGFGGAERDQVGRAYLAALALLALTELDTRGYALRSRCDLVCEGRSPLELIHADGQVVQLDLDRTTARALYEEALGAALAAGFDLKADPLVLQPQEKLVTIVKKSERLALEGKGGDKDKKASESESA